MDPSSMTGNKIENIAAQLLAYSLYRQGRTEESAACLGKMTSADEDLCNKIALGLLCIQMNKWDEAISCWKELSVEGICKSGYASEVSNGYLKAAVYYSEQERWEEAFSCLAQGRLLCAENPILCHVPARIESDLPLIFQQTGEYDKAVSLWEEQLKDGNANPVNLHLLAISALSRICNVKDDSTVEKRIEFIRRAHMYWCALAVEESYWDGRYNERRDVYGEGISLTDFRNASSRMGIDRCTNLLDQFEGETSENANESLKTEFEDARTAMAVEEHSAMLLAEICSKKGLDWPSGGLGALSFIWGEEKLKTHLDQTLDRELGSTGWLLAGLVNPDTCKAFLRYLMGAYMECAELCKCSNNPSMEDLAALSVVTRLEDALAAKQYQGCRDLAKQLKNISDQKLKTRGKAALEKMVPHRIKTLRRQGQEDEAILLSKDVLGVVTILPVAETLSGMLLKRSEKRYDKDDLDGFLQDYGDALRYAKDRTVCEKYLMKICRYHLNKEFKEKNFNNIFEFLNRLQRKYPRFLFIKSQMEFFKGLQVIEKGSVSDSRAIQHFENAYQANRSDTEVATIYSLALANKAVETINKATSGYVTPGIIQNAMRESESMLVKALEIDPNNKKAKENLLQLIQLAPKANYNMSPKAMRIALGGIVKGL